MSREDSLGALREVLLTRREALRSGQRSELSALQADGTDPDTEAPIAERTSVALLEAERALAIIDGRVKDVRFGVCEICKEPIPLARLQALPMATTCIGCAREAEKKTSPRAQTGGRIPDVVDEEEESRPLDDLADPDLL